jgi:serine/threonine-protein kinase
MMMEYLNEARQCSRLIHPNIARLYQFGEKPAPWITMEYLAKGTLTRRIGRLSIPEALRIGISLADALAFGRTLRLTHRSICPDNVLFDEKETPKLINWRIGAITQKLHKNLSLENHVTAYYPPEKIASGMGTIDWLTDIYQLGALLYEMLTAQPAFPGKGKD